MFKNGAQRFYLKERSLAIGIWRFLFWGLFCGLLTSAAYGAGDAYYRLGGTIISKSSPVGDQIRVRYYQSCDAELVGFVLKSRGRALEVGALMKANAWACTSLSTYKTAVLPLIKYSSYEQYFSMMPPSTLGRLKPVGVTHLEFYKDQFDPKKWHLQALYQGACGAPLGVILAPKRISKISIGFLEFQKTPDSSTCTESLELADLRGLKIAASDPGKVFEPARNNLNHRPTFFEPRWAMVRRNSMRVTDDSISFVYQRRCNEAPLAPIVSFDPKKQSYEIRMTTAFFPNLVCTDRSSKWRWDRYRIDFIQRPKSKKIELVNPSRLQMRTSPKLLLIPPYYIDKQSEDQLMAHHLIPCNPVVGTALIQKKHKLFVAVAQVIPNGSQVTSVCSDPFNSYAATIPGIKLSKRELVPLRLKDRF